MRRYSFLLITLLIICTSCSISRPTACGPTPTKQQIELQDMEEYAFIHYSLNTYTDQEWGYGNEDVNLFNPKNLDPRQWARTCKESGMKGIIFTVKHHCGFCMWPSAYTEYSVKNSPWKNGQGDVVKELAEACKEYGLRFAVYLSPWDRNHAEYGRPAYIDYFRNQLRELLTNYGDIYEVWFDGANGGNGYYGGANETRHIDRTTYYQWAETYRMIRELQPNIVIWNDGGDRGDLRWVGTEAGFIGETNWSLLNKDGDVPFEMLHYGLENGNVWVPGETNTSIRPGWFYHDQENSRVKSLSKLMETYYKSVGRNSTLLLNFPITRDGLIHQEDSLRGSAFAKMVREIFSNDLIEGASLTATNTRNNSSKYSIKHAIDGKTNTYWATDDDVKTAAVTIDFGKPTTFNRFMTCEYIQLGQRVKDFKLEVFVNGTWEPLKDIYAERGDGMTTVGRKRIICFPTVTASKLRFTIVDSKACPLISRLGVFLAPELTPDIPGSGEKYSTKWNVSLAGGGNGNGRSVIIDLKGKKNVKGLRYLPPQDRNTRGIVMDYAVFASVGNGEWKEISKGEFSNIVNNPIWQTVNFPTITTDRIRLDAVRLASGERIRFEDIDVVTE